MTATDTSTEKRENFFFPFDPALIYTDTSFATALQVGQRKRQQCINELRREGRLLVDGGNHPIAKGSDWLEALQVVTTTG